MPVRALSFAAVLCFATLTSAIAQPCGVSAQTVAIGPTSQLCFEPSLDHAATTPDGLAKVTSYGWGYYLPGATAPVVEFDLGKPTPAADGTIRVVPPQLMLIPLDILYEARVAAIGPTGRGVSTPSNGFFRSGLPRAPAKPVIKP